MHINELFKRQAHSKPFTKAVVYRNWQIIYQTPGKKAYPFFHYLRSSFKIKIGNVIGFLHPTTLLSSVKNINLPTRIQIAIAKQRGD